MSDQKRKLLLLAEDNAVLSAMYKAAFEVGNDIDIDFAYDGAAAINTAKERKPDMILLDILMPGIDGMEVLKTLKGAEDTKNIKIVILTALANPEVRDKAEQLGVDGYLIKSDLKLSDIVKKVREQLGME